MNIQQPASNGQPLRPRPPRRLRLRHWRATLSSHARAAARQGRLLSWRALRPPCDRRGPRKSHRRSSSPRMPRRSRSSSWNGSWRTRWDEARADGRPESQPLPFRRLWALAGPLPQSLNAGTQEPKPSVRLWEGIGEPETDFCCPSDRAKRGEGRCGLASRA